MARIELPESRLRTRRRRRFVRLLLVAAVLLLLLLGGLVALSHARFLRVDTIAVSGTDQIASSTVEAFVRERLSGSWYYLFARDNIFSYPKQQLTADLGVAYPSFKSVDVHAEDFRTVAVVVVERQPTALWCSLSDLGASALCKFMDEDGVVYAPAPAGSEAAYVQYFGVATPTVESPGASQYLRMEQFRSLVTLVGALSGVIVASTVERVSVDDNGDARLTFQNGFILVCNLSEAGGDVFERFTLALKSSPFAGRALGDFEYLDLRFGDKLYYKLQ